MLKVFIFDIEVLNCIILTVIPILVTYIALFLMEYLIKGKSINQIHRELWEKVNQVVDNQINLGEIYINFLGLIYIKKIPMAVWSRFGHFSDTWRKFFNNENRKTATKNGPEPKNRDQF